MSSRSLLPVLLGLATPHEVRPVVTSALNDWRLAVASLPLGDGGAGGTNRVGGTSRAGGAAGGTGKLGGGGGGGGGRGSGDGQTLYSADANATAGSPGAAAAAAAAVTTAAATTAGAAARRRRSLLFAGGHATAEAVAAVTCLARPAVTLRDGSLLQSSSSATPALSVSSVSSALGHRGDRLWVAARASWRSSSKGGAGFGAPPPLREWSVLDPATNAIVGDPRGAAAAGRSRNALKWPADLGGAERAASLVAWVHSAFDSGPPRGGGGGGGS